MLRVRFHGRGGHGIKTAGRILGTAAFLQGLQVQDSPVYGAERRGAALAAYTRIDSGPILERGIIPDPDLVLVADETLLADPSARVWEGRDFASAAFVNSPQDGMALVARWSIPCSVYTMDLTSLAITALGKGSVLGSVLSAALGAAACALVGFVPAEAMARAVQTELSELRLATPFIERNLELAHTVFASLPAVKFRERPALVVAGSMHVPAPIGGVGGAPVVKDVGNASARHTGSWRIFRPVIDLDACTRCGICFALCPDGAISLDAQSFPVIDYDNCKGCMICHEECPVKCILEQKEVRAW